MGVGYYLVDRETKVAFSLGKGDWEEVGFPDRRSKPQTLVERFGAPGYLRIRLDRLTPDERIASAEEAKWMEWLSVRLFDWCGASKVVLMDEHRFSNWVEDDIYLRFQRDYPVTGSAYELAERGEYDTKVEQAKADSAEPILLLSKVNEESHNHTTRTVEPGTRDWTEQARGWMLDLTGDVGRLAVAINDLRARKP